MCCSRKSFIALVILVVALFLTSTPAWAQSDVVQRWEVTPMVGFESGASAPNPNAYDASGNPISAIDSNGIDKGMSYGGWVDYSQTNNLQFEFMWVRNPTAYTQHDVTVNKSFKAYDADVNQFGFGILYHILGNETFRPYVAGGLGFAHESDSNSATSTAFSFNVGGGVKYYLTKHFGARADFRLIPTSAGSSVGQICDPYYGCYTGSQRNYFKRVNIAGGLIIRF